MRDEKSARVFTLRRPKNLLRSEPWCPRNPDGTWHKPAKKTKRKGARVLLNGPVAERHVCELADAHLAQYRSSELKLWTGPRVFALFLGASGSLGVAGALKRHLIEHGVEYRKSMEHPAVGKLQGVFLVPMPESLARLPLGMHSNLTRER